MKIRAITLFCLICMLGFSTSLRASEVTNDVAYGPAERPAGFANSTSEKPELDDSFTVWRSVGAMIFILAGLLAVNVYLKKRYDGSISTKENKLIKCLETMSIDQRRKIMLLEVEGEKVLVGVSSDRMDSLAVLSQEARDKKQETRGQA